MPVKVGSVFGHKPSRLGLYAVDSVSFWDFALLPSWSQLLSFMYLLTRRAVMEGHECFHLCCGRESEPKILSIFSISMASPLGFVKDMNLTELTVQYRLPAFEAPWAATDSAAALSTDKGNKWQDGIRQCATKLNHCQGSRDLKDLSGLLKHKTDWFHLLSIISYWGEQEALKESESNVISGIFKHLSFQLETIMY